MITSLWRWSRGNPSMQHHQDINACYSGYRNMITQYNTFQVKMWSWKTSYRDFLPRQNNSPIEHTSKYSKFDILFYRTCWLNKDKLSCSLSTSSGLMVNLHKNIQTWSFNPDCFNIIRGAIVRDPVHTTVYRLTLNGWPARMRDVPCIACHFWGTRDELTIEEDVLLKGNRICIAPELHNRSLYELHDSHQGVEKVTHLAKTSICWPEIDADIAE